jgi:hypothetical protein
MKPLEPDDAEGAFVRPRHWLDTACAWLALAIPLGLTLLRASPSPQWRDDLAVVRGLGLVPVGGEGTLSSVLMQLASLLPIGGRLLRASLVSALCLAAASWLIFTLTRRTLDTNAKTPRLTPALALAAALTATLAPTWQLEGTIAGGATLAAALALAGLLLRPNAASRDARVWVGFGALTAAAAVESHAAGLVLLGALGAQIALRGELLPRRSLALCAGGAAVVLVLCLVPLWTRPFAPHAWVDLGFGLSSADVVPIDSVAERSGAIQAWLAEVGFVSILLAIAGALFGLARARTRAVIVPFAVFVAADLVFPASRAGTLAIDSLAAVRLLAVAALALAAALGVHTAALLLERARLPMARAAAVMLVVFDFTLVLVTGEDASFLADRRSQHGADVWTDEALGNLPARSVLLVRSEAVAWRLWAAWVVRGERPDVLVAPLPLLERGSVAARLLEIEPALAPLVRELAISGRPSEFALSSLADTRPVFVEFDPGWDRRLVDHLLPHGLWLRFSAHAVGRSDRDAALRRSRHAFERTVESAKQPTYRDEATLAILSARASEQATVLAALGDRASVAHLLEDLRRLDPAHPVAAELERRFEKTKRGRIDVAGLLPNLEQ